MTNLRGIIRGNTIEWQNVPGLRDGQVVEISIRIVDGTSEVPERVPTAFSIHGPRGGPITSLTSWETLAPPTHLKHWKDGRSAMELARYWLQEGQGARFPDAVQLLLNNTPATADFVPRQGFAELITRLDRFGGNHRNHDLVLIGEAKGVMTLIGVEAKADEPFGSEYVGQYFSKMSRVPRSNVPKRITTLCQIVFGSPYGPADIIARVGGLRYQLLTAVAGTLLEAKQRSAAQAVFLVQEFTSQPDLGKNRTGTDVGKVAANRTDLAAFIRNLPGGASVKIPESGDFLLGPFNHGLSGDDYNTIPLYLGKVSTPLN